MTLLIDKDKKKELTLGRKINPSDFSVETVAPPPDHHAELVAQVKDVAAAVRQIEVESTDLTAVVGALNSVASVLDKVAVALNGLGWKRAKISVSRDAAGQISTMDLVKEQ